MIKEKYKIAIIGLGYIGLPLSIAFSKFHKVFGYDNNKERIKNIFKNINHKSSFNKNNLIISDDIKNIKNCNIFIITVPTPVFKNKSPNLNPLKNASKNIAKFLKKNDIVIYESTVYPGTTEDILVPILEKYSKLKYNYDFFCGYSPERLNPGSFFEDISKIVKITSGSNLKTAIKIDKLYGQIIKAGTYRAENIKIAEAAKVIENCQRDLNISLVNEFYLIFEKLKIDSYKVLKAASTKWNFLSFKPGLVGGHCIGVDPYYLTYVSKIHGYRPKVILSGREINDEMSFSLSKIFLKNLRQNNFKMNSLKILIMGFTFKEDCEDTRNSKIFDLYLNLSKHIKNIDIYDPVAIKGNVKKNYGINLIKYPKLNYYDGVMVLNSHKIFKKMGLKKIIRFGKSKSLIYDFKDTFKQKSHIFLKKDV